MRDETGARKTAYFRDDRIPQNVSALETHRSSVSGAGGCSAGWPCRSSASAEAASSEPMFAWV